VIYKPNGARYWMAKWKFRGEVVRRSTRESNKKAAYSAELRMRTEFNREREETERAAEELGCAETLVVRCPECRKSLRSDRAIIGVDGAKLCSEECRKVWNKRCQPVPMLAEFLERDFLPAFADKDSTKTYYGYGSRLLESGLPKLRLDEITSQHAKQFAAAHLPKLSPSTINCALRTLRHALNLAEEWGKLDRAPKIPLADGERQRDRVVTDAEFAAYLALCRQPWRDIALLVRYEGLRPWDEAAPLRWENVLLNGNGGLILITSGKSKAARRQLPMTPEVFAALKTRHLEQGEPEEGWIFPADTESGHTQQGSGKNIHGYALHTLEAATAECTKNKQKDWVRAVVKATKLTEEFVRAYAEVIQKGVPWFEPYCLRHTAFTRLAESGCDAFTLAKIAGHTSITMTQKYCHPQAEAIERAFAKLLPVAREGKREGSPTGVTLKKARLRLPSATETVIRTEIRG
jgi:integrase